MFIVFFVGVLVVVAVRVGPPECAALDCEARPDGHYELEGARCGKSFVREVAVEETGDGEHPEEVESDGSPNGDGAGSDPDDAKAT